MVSGSSRGGNRCELWNDNSRESTGRRVMCNGSRSSRVVALMCPGGDPGWGVDLLVNKVEDLVIIVKGEEFLSGGLLAGGE